MKFQTALFKAGEMVVRLGVFEADSPREAVAAAEKKHDGMLRQLATGDYSIRSAGVEIPVTTGVARK